MVVRRDSRFVYIDLTDDEFEYFLHVGGLDMDDTVDLTEDDLQIIAEEVCALVNQSESMSRIPGLADLVESISNKNLNIDIIETNQGVQLRIQPLDGKQFAVDQLNQLYKGLNSKNYTDEGITEDFLDSTITSFLKNIYSKSSEIPFEFVLSGLVTTELFFAWVTQEVKKELDKKCNKGKKLDTNEITKEKVNLFAEKCKKIYESLQLQYFYQVKDLDTALKAMKLIKKGVVFKVKDCYYITSDKDIVSLIEYGTKVDEFVYTEDSIICRIKDGKFDVPKKEGKANG